MGQPATADAQSISGGFSILQAGQKVNHKIRQMCGQDYNIYGVSLSGL